MQYRDPFAKNTAHSTIQDPDDARSGARREMFASVGESKANTYDMGLRSYMLKIYNYMASALALTGIVALVFAQLAVTSDAEGGHLALTGLGQAIYMSPLKWVIMLAPLGMVMWMSFGIHRLSASTAQALFWAFSALMGLSLSSIFLVYTGESIARAFFITAGMFGGMSIYGYTTKRDLTGMGSFMFMGLIGVILASLVNLFVQSSGLSFVLSILTVFIFVGLTAYDTQKLKDMYYQLGSAGEMAKKMAIMGALSLYMDFINIFISLLRLFGDRR